MFKGIVSRRGEGHGIRLHIEISLEKQDVEEHILPYLTEDLKHQLLEEDKNLTVVFINRITGEVPQRVWLCKHYNDFMLTRMSGAVWNSFEIGKTVELELVEVSDGRLSIKFEKIDSPSGSDDGDE